MLTATRISMPGVPEQARVARRWLAGWLGEEHPAHYAAVQLLSEAFGNSVLYAVPGGQIELGAELGDQQVLVEVVDAGGGGDPVPGQDPAGDAESGRGLFILDALAKEWGWERLPDTRLRFWFTVGF
ncbi:ATP-binding protein [Actinocorallia sp. A-T 12471]|uniref:ATP-binding protein n=1 Tax=Actinocorallia sp. A-T 12471 TaxID=3089813 RepID=UPI0029CEBB67|nr:ATP-binding protein [Actinocorallia sp. A-T 12471]MDX6742488.1 ATP-binding protein [Actinocorallia sp. A-T 12471]